MTAPSELRSTAARLEIDYVGRMNIRVGDVPVGALLDQFRRHAEAVSIVGAQAGWDTSLLETAAPSRPEVGWAPGLSIIEGATHQSRRMKLAS